MNSICPMNFFRTTDATDTTDTTIWKPGLKTKNERFTAAGSRCRQNLKYANPRGCSADYVKNLQQKACRACSMIIFPYSTGQVFDLWR